MMIIVYLILGFTFSLGMFIGWGTEYKGKLSLKNRFVTSLFFGLIFPYTLGAVLADLIIDKRF